ncbi:MAG: hypothetical protein H7263_07190 [Candidatus Sericytochromatia bacterium]|nr:hypothetical protein [Candidatus Sericytochromatia bacterium]
MNNLKKMFFLSFILIIVSCSTKTRNKSSFDIYSDDYVSKETSISEIKLRQDKIANLNFNIIRIENYNSKLKQKITYDNSFNLYNESMESAYDKNKKIIDQLKMDSNQLKTEIRVIKRRIKNVENDN